MIIESRSRIQNPGSSIPLFPLPPSRAGRLCHRNLWVKTSILRPPVLTLSRRLQCNPLLDGGAGKAEAFAATYFIIFNCFVSRM